MEDSSSDINIGLHKCPPPYEYACRGMQGISV